MAAEHPKLKKNWGERPWSIDFQPTRRVLPDTVEFAVIGGGFSGLSAAAWLKMQAPDSIVALFETGRIGAGASGHTGGVALAESAAGDLPGLGDVLAGYKKIRRELGVDADLVLPGCYELARTQPLRDSPIRWEDSGALCVTKEVPGGTINPGKVVSGLARSAEGAGALLFEDTAVEEVIFLSDQELELRTRGRSIRAQKALVATDAFSLELTGIEGKAAFTTAVMTEPLDESALEQLGLAGGKPFYTVDLPYLWGRLFGDGVIFGAGLISFDDWRSLDSVDIEQKEAAEVFARLEKRVRRLHPLLHKVNLTHRWGGPICFTDDWKPVFRHHPRSVNAIVLGAFSGHGVALSVYLGAWAAEALLGRRSVPNWD